MKTVIVLLLCVLLFSPAMAYAETPDALITIVDIGLVRPVSLVATAIGTAAFLVAFPFALASGSVNDTAYALVGEPFEFTFTRAPGDFRMYSTIPTKPLKGEDVPKDVSQASKEDPQ